jgi:type II secretory pathway component PulF
MNWLELCVFTENLSKMLENGIMFQKAMKVASGSMIHRKNRKFAAKLNEAIIEGIDIQQHLSLCSVPVFYLAILKCGQLTGRLPEALKAANYFLKQLMPLKLCLRRYILFSISAYLVSLLITGIFCQHILKKQRGLVV